MKKRDLNLEKYHITKNRYRELYYFCLQYEERKKKIAELCDQSPPPPNGMPRSGKIPKQTEKAGILAASLSIDNETVEQAAIETSADLYPWLLKAVTKGMNYNAMRMQEGIPCNEKEFRQLRYKFFFLLDQMKK